jgi:flagellar protein FliO/FliZ
MNPIATPPIAPSDPDVWMIFIKTAGMLSLVVALLLVVLYLVRRYSLQGGRSLSGKNPIRMIASYHLAPREKVVLIDVSGERILLGVTPQTINALAILNREDIPETGMMEDREKKGFKTLLSTALQKGGKRMGGGADHGK